jgi:hypothetical protein
MTAIVEDMYPIIVTNVIGHLGSTAGEQYQNHHPKGL